MDVFQKAIEESRKKFELQRAKIKKQEELSQKLKDQRDSEVLKKQEEEAQLRDKQRQQEAEAQLTEEKSAETESDTDYDEEEAKNCSEDPSESNNSFFQREPEEKRKVAGESLLEKIEIQNIAQKFTRLEESKATFDDLNLNDSGDRLTFHHPNESATVMDSSRLTTIDKEVSTVQQNKGKKLLDSDSHHLETEARPNKDREQIFFQTGLDHKEPSPFEISSEHPQGMKLHTAKDRFSEVDLRTSEP